MCFHTIKLIYLKEVVIPESASSTAEGYGRETSLRSEAATELI